MYFDMVKSSKFTQFNMHFDMVIRIAIIIVFKIRVILVEIPVEMCQFTGSNTCVDKPTYCQSKHIDTFSRIIFQGSCLYRCS